MELNNIDNSQQERWIPLESNDKVFNHYFQGIGLTTDYYFDELISFDYHNLQCNINKKTEVVISIFQKAKPAASIYNDKDFTSEKDVQFYMIQNDLITNACGLVAGLQAIGNLDQNKAIKSGSLLDHFFTSKKSPEEYAYVLSKNKEWKDYHIKQAVKGDSIIPENPKDVVYHYVTFIFNPIDSYIYELDGRLNKPYRHIKIKDKESLLDNVISITNKRLENGLIMDNVAVLLLLKKNSLI